MVLGSLVSLFALLSAAQKPQSACFITIAETGAVPQPTAFAQCNYLDKAAFSCAKLSGPSFLACQCQQKYFNAIFDCESENRECFDNQLFDNQFEQIASKWHDDCDNYITYTPTTPKVSSLTTTTGAYGNADYCNDVLSTCDAASTFGLSCVSKFPSSSQEAELSSCVCQASYLSAVSVCRYDYNQTCLGFAAATSNIPLWSTCAKQVSQFVQTRVTSTSGLPKSLSLGPAPGSASGKSGAHASSTSTSVAASTEMIAWWAGPMATSMFILTLVAWL